MLLALIGIVVGLMVLSFAADQFVIGAVRLSVKANISPVIVGAVIIGFGTSLPEFVVSGLASFQDGADLAVANVIGSNSANLALVLGIAIIMTRIQVPASVKRRELPIALVTAGLFALIIQRPLSVTGGVILAVVFVFSISVMLLLARNEHPAPLDTYGMSANFIYLRLFGGLGGTLAGAQLLITSARFIASELGFSEGLVGLTLVAIGTSLPELATTVAAARRRQGALIIGNLLGSNLFNATAVGAIAVVFAPGVSITNTVSGVATIVMLGISVAVGVAIVAFRSLPRIVGVLLIAGYIATMPLLF
ncbi:MAG: hypothetical protein WD360_02640 [Nitriliruptoraceae bacterium]